MSFLCDEAITVREHLLGKNGQCAHLVGAFEGDERRLVLEDIVMAKKAQRGDGAKVQLQREGDSVCSTEEVEYVYTRDNDRNTVDSSGEKKEDIGEDHQEWKR